MSTEIPIFEGVEFKIFFDMLDSRTYLRLERVKFNASNDMIEVEIPENLRRTLLIPTPHETVRDKKYFAVVIRVGNKELAQKIIDKIVPVIDPRPCDIYSFELGRYAFEG